MRLSSYKYVELATVAVQQPFYSNNTCRNFEVKPALDFELVPSAECQAVMRRLDLVFRNTEGNGGFTVLARAAGRNAAGNDVLRFPASAGDKLTFWMRLLNPEVLNFDDLPTSNDSNKIYYFTNQQTDAAAPRTSLHISSGSTGVSGTDDQIARGTANYRFHHIAELTPGAAKVRHLLSGAEVSPTAMVNRAGRCDLTFDLGALPLGKCQLAISGKLIEVFYYEGNPPSREFGVVELVLAHTLQPNYRIIEQDRSLTKDRPAYFILFRNRRTRWRYTIHLQPSSPLSVEMAGLSPEKKSAFLDDLRLTTNDTAVAFSRSPAGNGDLVFVSDIEIALRERYISSSSTSQDPLRLTLKKHVGNPAKEAVVRSDLPYPRTALIDARAAPLIYSDTFLTL